MAGNYQLEPPDPNLEYWGNSDLLAQIAYELRNAPTTCFSQNIFAWYNNAYALPDSETNSCSYQIAINESLCPNPESPSTIADIIKVVVNFSQGKNRRIALVALRIIFREAQRQIIENTARTV